MTDYNDKDEISPVFPLIALVFGLLIGLVIGWNICMNRMDTKKRVEYRCNGKVAMLHLTIDNGTLTHELHGCKEVK